MSGPAGDPSQATGLQRDMGAAPLHSALLYLASDGWPHPGTSGSRLIGPLWSLASVLKDMLRSLTNTSGDF